MGKNYYELLGVSRDASTADIEQAYRERLKETHPDVNSEEDATDRTKCLIAAKKMLTDDVERDRYDRLGHGEYLVHQDTAVSDISTTASNQRGTDRTAGPGSTDHDATRDTATSSAGARAGSGVGGGMGNATGGENAGAHDSRQQTKNPEEKRGRRARASSAQDAQIGGWRAADETNARAPYATQNAYTTNRATSRFAVGDIVSSSEAAVLLGLSFLVYPAMLYGAFSPEFPLVLNLIVAVCVVFLVAFLQSVPGVAVGVFGSWSVLLSFVLFLGGGPDPLSPLGLVALSAVLLSLLTLAMIRPVS